MTTFLLQMLKAVWRGRVNWFWPIWVLITGGVVIGVASVVGHASTPIAEKDKEEPINRARPHARSAGAAAALTLVVLLLAGYIAVSLKWEDFANYDDSYFTLFTLRGHDLSPSI